VNVILEGLIYFGSSKGPLIKSLVSIDGQDEMNNYVSIIGL
jgi:hypothetical protein